MEEITKKEKRMNEIKKRLNNHYIELASVLAENKINQLKMTTLGNSIATGFALNHMCIPLIQRVAKELEVTLNEKEIKFIAHDLAMIVNNSDYHVNDFLVNDHLIKNIIRLNKIYWYQDENVKLIPPKYQITWDYLELMYGYMDKSEGRLSDVLFNEEKNVANILIYSGITSRSLGFIYNNEAKTFVSPFDLIEQDQAFSRHSMSFINEKNRRENANTQVYIMGNPNYFNAGIIDVVYNRRLKLTAKTFPCTNYVPSIPTTMFYKTGLKNDVQFENRDNLNFMDKLCQHTGIINDPHYNEEQYLKALEKVFISIKENYLQTKISIELDRLITNECNQNGLNMSYEQPVGIIEKINDILEANNLSNKEKITALEEFNKYFLYMYPAEFKYLWNNFLITDAIKKIRK